MEDIGRCIFLSYRIGSRNITGDNELKKYITSYYKNLFRPHEDSSLRIDERCRDDIPQVTLEEKELLVQCFSEEEVKKRCFRSNTTNPRGLMAFWWNSTR
jgi:hypothetical protein